MAVNRPNRGIGIGQTWQDVTASRAVGTTYYNTGQLPIAVTVTVDIPAATTVLALTSGMGIQSIQNLGASVMRASFPLVVPPGAGYSVSAGTVQFWRELK